jgi:hypothetical protein
VLEVASIDASEKWNPSAYSQGTCHPPKNKVAVMQPIKPMATNSLKEKTANFSELYSVKYPATSSDSASGMSNGALFDSAMLAVKNKKKAKG